MNASEPTTGEIVRALRCMADDTECKDCRYKYPVGNVILCDHEQMNGNAADRLESQEQAIEELKSEAIVNALENAERIANLTARAEQAEADIKKFAHTSHTCGHNESGLCKLAADDHGFYEKCPAWVYRGQPQDGEGKK